MKSKREILLDVPSILKSGLDITSKKRLYWHIPHCEYDELTSQLYSWIKDINLSNEDLKVFEIVKPLVFQSLSAYLTHVYDSIKIREYGLHSKYDKQSNIFLNKIYNKIPVDVIANIQLEQVRFNKNIKKKAYSILLERMPNFFLKKVRISRNPLNTQNNNNSLDLLAPYHFPIDLSNSSESTRITQLVTNELISKIELKYFPLKGHHIDSIFNIVNTCMNRVINDLYRYNGFLKGVTSILTGTGCKYYNRLLPYLVTSNHNATASVKVFSHGGERVFFEDNWYWDCELSYASEYISYGHQSSYVLKKMLNNNVTFKSIGSNYCNKIYNKHFSNVVSSEKKILYIPNSFVGESRQFPNAKIIDPILLDWQLYLIRKMQLLGYVVIYKRHPKGFFHDQNSIGRVADYETNLPMEEALYEADTVVCDSAGSATVESICAGKNVILIDMKQRPFNIFSSNDFKDLINIISVEWKDNLPYIDDDLLLSAIRRPASDSENRKRLIKEYFINE